MSSGGTEIVLSGGTDLGATISGTVTVSSGGTFELTSGTTGLPTLLAGATLEVGSGAVFSGTVSSGVKVKVLSGGTDSGITISSGRHRDCVCGRDRQRHHGSERRHRDRLVRRRRQRHDREQRRHRDRVAGGTASGATVSSGGTLDVLSGGLADPTTIYSGGREIVSAHGTDDGAQISGGKQLVYGSASGATVFTGTQVVESGGTANNTTVSSGGTEIVLSGGTDIDATIDTGGTAIIAAGGILETTIGGTAIVSGTVTNSGMLFASGSGSLVEIASGAVVNGGIAMVGNGIVDIQGSSNENVKFLSGGSGGLELDDATTYTGKVSGFGGSGHSNHSQFIDLTAVTFSSGVVSETYSGNTTSGVLTVTSGGTTVATIDMVGPYVTSNFTLTAGSGGIGTIITDPSITEQQAGNAPATIAGGTVLEINTPDFGKVTFGGTAGTCSSTSRRSSPAPFPGLRLAMHWI